MSKEAATARVAAIIGGGVIGGGWAARFLLHGWRVQVYDPHPDAPKHMDAVLANARASLPGLADVPMPAEGELVFCSSIADAVAEAQWVQESVPEDLAIKHEVLAEIEAHAPEKALIGSSTSGFKPGELQLNAKHPERIFVAHPFNPVYLLPLAELVPGAAVTDENREQAADVLRAIGMKPLHVRAEIDAHIADRFLEAVWREALWLVKDDVATTEEIDDAIRFGFGLRWAQMGLFETYRVAGGAGGMRHFIAQFGEALTWPWTKLTDVPELTDELGAEHEGARLLVRQAQRSTQALVELDVDDVVLDIQIDEMVGRQRRLPDHRQQIQIGPDLRASRARLLGQLGQRDAVAVRDVRDDEQQSAETIADAHGALAPAGRTLGRGISGACRAASSW
jgi:3-hydroxyacyl-CoA dehydrogenase